jgi:hypothetical protein
VLTNNHFLTIIFGKFQTVHRTFAATIRADILEAGIFSGKSVAETSQD